MQTPATRGVVARALGCNEMFERWVDPQSGVESYILRSRIAPIQQSFYFTNSGFTADGRYLWFYCAFPPGGDAYYGRQLAVADFQERTLRHFPETQFTDASPFVDPATGEVYWTTGLGIWKRGPRPSDEARCVGRFPADLAKGRRPLRIATHLNRSADGKSFAIDAEMGNEWYVGDLEIATGEFHLWQRFELCHNHAQFSPVDPDLMLITQDGWVDPSTGREGRTQDRLWLLRRGGRAEPLLPSHPLPSSLRGHEWWSATGDHVWFVDYHAGTSHVNIATGHRTIVWPRGRTHSHGDRTGQYLVGDSNHNDSDIWSVGFFNIRTGREIAIVTQLPLISRRPYHLHPHPRFCLDDQFVCYTTNVLGGADIAIVPVSSLIDRTR